jgi:hypothetical protein
MATPAPGPRGSRAVGARARRQRAVITRELGTRELGTPELERAGHDDCPGHAERARLQRRCMRAATLPSVHPAGARPEQRSDHTSGTRVCRRRGATLVRRQEKNAKPSNGQGRPRVSPAPLKSTARSKIERDRRPRASRENIRSATVRGSDLGRAEASAAQKSIRIKMVQTDRKIPWTTAAALSFTVGWWKESVAVIGQVGTGLSGSRAHFRR